MNTQKSLLWHRGAKGFSLLLLVGTMLFGGITNAQTPQVNMSRYITLNVTKDELISIALRTDTANTPVRIVSGDKEYNFSTSSIGLTNVTTYYAGANTMTIYGDVKDFRCFSNKTKVTGIDVSNNIALCTLLCYDNNISALDISKNTALIYLSCRSNQLTSLDVTKNTMLTQLYCYTNQLTSLDVSQNVALCTLSCYGNPFTTAGYDSIMCSLPDRSGIAEGFFYPLYDANDTNATKFGASNSLNAKAKNWNVQYYSGEAAIPETTGDYECPFMANSSRYITLNVTKDELISIGLHTDTANTPIKIVSGAWDTTIITADNKETGAIECKAEDETMTIYGDVKAFYCNDNKTKVTGIDISNNTALCTLSCYRNQLTSLDVSKNTALTDLNCDNSQLTSLDVSKNTALCTLNCSFNKLTSLDVSACTSLVELYCVTNSLTSLNVSGCTSLTTLSFYNNSLTSLDVSTCTSLKNLDCSENQLTTLNIRGCTSLESLHCSENQLTTLNIRGCTSLRSLTCYSNLFTIAGYDSLMCLLPDRSANSGGFYPLINPNDTNYSVFAASNATNATAKNWKVMYPYESTALETTGNFNCNGLSIEEGEDAMGIALYPNPAKTMLNIENAIGNVQIFDITGRMLINVENKETNLLQINVSNLSKGMYFVKVGNYTTKFVKE